MIFAELSVGFVAGVALGALYFGALWLTVRSIPSASAPVPLAVGSYLVRLLGLGIGLYVVVRVGGAVPLLAALPGILAARQLIIGRIAPEHGRIVRPSEDAGAADTAQRDPAAGTARGRRGGGTTRGERAAGTAQGERAAGSGRG